MKESIWKPLTEKMLCEWSRSKRNWLWLIEWRDKDRGVSQFGQIKSKVHYLDTSSSHAGLGQIFVIWVNWPFNIELQTRSSVTCTHLRKLLTSTVCRGLSIITCHIYMLHPSAGRGSTSTWSAVQSNHTWSRTSIIDQYVWVWFRESVSQIAYLSVSSSNCAHLSARLISDSSCPYPSPVLVVAIEA